MKTAIIIPARFASTRFPGKPLHLLAGKPMIQHVWERGLRARLAARVIIATDDERIRCLAEGFGADVEMTRPDHPSGTDRIGEVMGNHPDLDAAINVQGDEPMVSPALIDALIAELADDAVDMVTAAVPTEDPVLMADPNVVKVVVSRSGRAIFFSRSPIPYDRQSGGHGARFLWHKGIYGYRRKFLLDFLSWPPSPLEQAEQLEQLRALENHAFIRVVETDDTGPGVDTPDQAAEVGRLLAEDLSGLP